MCGGAREEKKIDSVFICPYYHCVIFSLTSRNEEETNTAASAHNVLTLFTVVIYTYIYSFSSIRLLFAPSMQYSCGPVKKRNIPYDILRLYKHSSPPSFPHLVSHYLTDLIVTARLYHRLSDN